MTAQKMWAVHDGPGKTEWGPFPSYNRAHSFVEGCDNLDFEDIYEVNVPDMKDVENRLTEKICEYVRAYDKWDGEPRDLRYILHKPRMAVDSPGYGYPLTRANIGEWYRYARVVPLRPNAYADIRDFNSDVREWMDDADTILFALDCAIDWLSHTQEE